MAFPFYYMAVTSFKTGKEVNQPVPTFLVNHPSGTFLRIRWSTTEF